jgi:four helix bundle protein
MVKSKEHTFQSFDRLRVWHEARTLIKEIYRLSENFPASEAHNLVSQMRRAAVSVAANIAEGTRRKTVQDYSHYLNMAEGSASEIKGLLTIASDVGYVSPSDSARLLKLADSITAMLFGLRLKIEGKK